MVRMPGGWLLGPMLVAILAGLCTPVPLRVPNRAVRVAQAAIGIIIASTFDPSSLPTVEANWLPIILVVGATLAVSVVSGILLARHTPMDKQTATLGTLPGGASGMIAMSISLGADTRIVSLMQYMRLVFAVGSAALVARFMITANGVPHSAALLGAATRQPLSATLASAAIALAGAWIGPRLRLPAAALLGPMLLAIAARATGIVHPGWPIGIAHAAYLTMGLYVGLLFDRTSLKQAGQLMPAILVSTAALIAVCAGTGKILSIVTGCDPLSGYLATTPGGLDSIAVVALGSGSNMSLILAVQMMRLLTIVIFGPLMARWILDRAAKNAADQIVL